MINREQNVKKLKFCKVMTVATIFLWQFLLRLIKTPGYLEQQKQDSVGLSNVKFGKIKTEVTWAQLNVHSANNKIDVTFLAFTALIVKITLCLDMILYSLVNRYPGF